MSIKLFHLQTGKEVIVKWFDKYHVQFLDEGISCARKDIGKFYGKESEKMLKEVQKVVDNYIKDMKKFDYPGKPVSKLKKAEAKSNSILSDKKYYEKLFRILVTLQPPEKIGKDLLLHNVGAWYQKDNYALNSNRSPNAPWVWSWNHSLIGYQIVNTSKIVEWLRACAAYDCALSSKDWEFKYRRDGTIYFISRGKKALMEEDE